MHECYGVKTCLEAYEKASGQVVNFQKSTISFSANTPVDVQEEIIDFLQVPITQNHGKYLGLPSLIGKK